VSIKVRQSPVTKCLPGAETESESQQTSSWC